MLMDNIGSQAMPHNWFSTHTIREQLPDAVWLAEMKGGIWWATDNNPFLKNVFFVSNHGKGVSKQAHKCTWKAYTYVFDENCKCF